MKIRINSKDSRTNTSQVQRIEAFLNSKDKNKHKIKFMNLFFGSLAIMVAFYWLFNQDENSQLSEKDLLELVRKKKVTKIEIELFKFKNPKTTNIQMEDKVNYFQGGKAKFQIVKKNDR
jgi:hypothetical protein